MDQTKRPITIKKYANRRLYNTETSSYVTLDDLAGMVKSERDFVVYDAKTGEDLTHGVLTQIILEQESRGQNLLPVNFLRQLIRFYGDSIGRLVPSYLELSIGTLTREQEKFRKQLTDAFGSGPFAPGAFGPASFGTAALDAIQEQTRQNMAMFEKALAMFTPFGPMAARPGGGEEAGKSAEAGAEAAEPRAAGVEGGAELSQLREQIEAMQRQLDKLARRKD